jgi:hypothetical protein
MEDVIAVGQEHGHSGDAGRDSAEAGHFAEAAVRL